MNRVSRLKGTDCARDRLTKWVRVYFWRRRGRKLSADQADMLNKRLAIITGQLDGMPVSSTVRDRRRQLLIDRERCSTMLKSWEISKQKKLDQAAEAAANLSS